MNTSSDAADQVVRIMLDGTEMLLKLSGAGAKQTAILLYSALKQQNKTSGQARLSSMLRSGKPLKVYTFRDGDLEKFKECAKEYGVLFCVLKDKDKSDGVFDVLVRAEDAAKLTRISERFNLFQVNATDIKADIIREAEEKAKKESAEKGANEEKEKSDEQPEAGKSDGGQNPPEQEQKVINQNAADELLGEGKDENPLVARTEANPEAKSNPIPSARSEGIPPAEGTPDMPQQNRMENGVSRAETTVSGTEKPDGSSRFVRTSGSDRSTADRNPEKKESVRAAMERIRRKREEAARRGETPRGKTKESKGKDR